MAVISAAEVEKQTNHETKAVIEDLNNKKQLRLR
jgi:hypothetical protein